MHRILGFVVTLGAALGASDALAWKHTQQLWNPDDLPVPYCVAPPEACPEGLPPSHCADALAAAHEAWDLAAPCGNLGGGLQSVCEPAPCPSANVFPDEDGMCSNLGFVLGDGRNSVGFDDPHREIEAGVLAVNATRSGAFAFQLFGQSYRWIEESDTVFNDQVAFATPEEILGGACDGRIDITSVAVHEIGHLHGLGHSCDAFENCVDPELRDAVMYWSRGACEVVHEPNSDDIDGINALYGPTVDFRCEGADGATLGAVPFAVTCAVEGDTAEIEEASWTMGDGAVETGLAVTHVYTEPGTYTVRLSVTGQRDSCARDDNPDGTWASSRHRVGLLTACGVPDVAFSAPHVDGLTHQTVNRTDVSVYGCIHDITWEVYAGEGLDGPLLPERTKHAWEPRITFPEAGRYTIVANVGGPAGVGAAMLVIDARDRRGAGWGCSHAAPPGAAGLLALALGLLTTRRRHGEVSGTGRPARP